MSEKNKIQREITERFIMAIESLPGSERQIAISLGLRQQHINRLRHNKNTYATLYACYLLCVHYKVNPTWLITGRGKMKMT